MNIFTTETRTAIQAQDMLRDALVVIAKNSDGFLDEDSISVESTGMIIFINKTIKLNWMFGMA